MPVGKDKPRHDGVVLAHQRNEPFVVALVKVLRRHMPHDDHRVALRAIAPRAGEHRLEPSHLPQRIGHFGRMHQRILVEPQHRVQHNNLRRRVEWLDVVSVLRECGERART
eukprot:Amastigsp_a676693_57.p2 type:complete len:111 gc:universal Amastigsp_a676693_57:985-653(-)